MEAFEPLFDAEASGNWPVSGGRHEPVQPADQSAERPQTSTVASLTERRLRQLPPDSRPLPTVDKYDDLLPSRRAARRQDA